ncbi:MAG: hypothetical protein K8T26_20305 [Lentisphaerae bacterium]|nr:hypothetical protein [Lentisphaerota bacterium]
MRRSGKPVRKCHACPLNLGDRCWRYASPRDQWRSGRHCAGFSDEALHAEFRIWLKRPQVKTRKELRREGSSASKRAATYSARSSKPRGRS